MSLALERAGWKVEPPLSRDDDLRGAALGVDLVLITTPDAAIADAAQQIEPVPTTVVAHLAGSGGLDVLAGHPRTAAIHPLVSMPDAETGAGRLLGAWFAIAGDPIAGELVANLDGHAFEVAD